MTSLSIHSPTINGAGNYASAATCSCGWQTGQLYRPVDVARAAYAKHLAVQAAR